MLESIIIFFSLKVLSALCTHTYIYGKSFFLTIFLHVVEYHESKSVIYWVDWSLLLCECIAFIFNANAPSLETLLVCIWHLSLGLKLGMLAWAQRKKFLYLFSLLLFWIKRTEDKIHKMLYKTFRWSMHKLICKRCGFSQCDQKWLQEYEIQLMNRHTMRKKTVCLFCTLLTDLWTFAFCF